MKRISGKSLKRSYQHRRKMAIKTSRLCSLPFLLLFFAASVVHAQSLRIYGMNRLTYWQWQDTTANEEHFLEDLLTVNAVFGNFRGNLEWFIYEPSEVASGLRKEGLKSRFLEFSKAEWAIRAGNFNPSFGRGLILNQMDDEPGNIQRDLDGLLFSYAYVHNTKKKLFEFSLISGKPRNIHFTNRRYYVVNDTTELLQGGTCSLFLTRSMPLSFSTIRLSSREYGSPFPKKTVLYTVTAEPSYGPCILFVEIAKKRGWDKLLFADAEGTGVYGALTLFGPRFATTIEYFQYDSLGYGGSTYRYNAPPTANIDNYSINRASDEKGWMADVTANPIDDWYLRINRSSLASISADSLGFEELYAEVKGALWRKGTTMLISAKSLLYRSPEPVIESKEELIPHLELLSSLGPHSIKVGFETRGVQIDSLGTPIAFRDNMVLVDVGIFSYLSISGRWEIRDKEVLLESEGTAWKVAEIRWDISDSHTLHASAGSEKGGLICTGGVCRIEEPFEGFKINLLSRF
jgi:hypothetical protein